MGCYQDKSQQRDMEVMLGDSLTVKECFDLAKRRGYGAVGLQNGNECYAGHSWGKHGRVADGECNYMCDNDQDKRCGGKLRNSVWDLTHYTGQASR